MPDIHDSPRHYVDNAVASKSEVPGVLILPLNNAAYGLEA
jgi:hypothetical protein